MELNESKHGQLGQEPRDRLLHLRYADGRREDAEGDALQCDSRFVGPSAVWRLFGVNT
jgi:hypothetical protein